MYICICNAVTDREIRAAVEDGHDSFPKVRACLGVGTNCGRCKQEACRVIREHKTEMNCAGAFAGAD